MALYESMSPRVFSFAARRLSGEAAKDIVSETFEIAWAKRHEWPADPDARAGWLFTICKYKVLQEAQRVQRKHHDNRFTEDYSTSAVSEPDFADTVVASVEGRAIYERLSEAEAEVFDVAFMSNLSRAEGAAMLGLTANAFYVRVSRLRDRIEKLQQQHVTHGSPS